MAGATKSGLSNSETTPRAVTRPGPHYSNQSCSSAQVSRFGVSGAAGIAIH
jgi:hypothetical protein